MTAGDRSINIEYSRTIPRSTQKLTWLDDFIKRAFDIVLSTLVIIFFSPIYALLAIIIKRDSPGPVFYRGYRIGRYGKPFRILKFRTMKETPECYDGPRVTAHDDARITGIGKWLRDTKLNEFPQFWNVLIGNMSLVGPRPEDPALAEAWPRSVRNEILSVRPGITSPASVRYHNEDKFLHACNVEQVYLSEFIPHKARLDQLYVRYRSFLLDLDTLFWTALTFFPRLGMYKLPEELLYLGVFSRFIQRFFNWFTIDLITALTTFGLTGLIFRLRAPLNIGHLNAFLLVSWFAIMFSSLGVIFGTNRIRWSKANPTDLFDLIPAWMIATVVALIGNIFIMRLPADIILVGSAFTLFGFVLTRSRRLIIQHFLERSTLFQRRNELIKERVLIIGLGASAQHTAWIFEHLVNSRYFHIVGFVDNDLTKLGARYFGSNVIGKWEDIPHLVKEHDIQLIILADYRVGQQGYQEIKQVCAQTNARLVVMPDILASVNQLLRQPVVKSGKPELRTEKMDPKCVDCLVEHLSTSKVDPE